MALELKTHYLELTMFFNDVTLTALVSLVNWSLLFSFVSLWFVFEEIIRLLSEKKAIQRQVS